MYILHTGNACVGIISIQCYITAHEFPFLVLKIIRSGFKIGLVYSPWSYQQDHVNARMDHEVASAPYADVSSSFNICI